MLIFAFIKHSSLHITCKYGLSTKIVAFLFLLIAALPVLLSINFIVKETLIQQQAMEEMESAVLKSLIIPASELQWIRNGKEVMIGGKLFDVKSFGAVNDQVILVGYFDEDEDRLLQQCKHMIENNKEDNQPVEIGFLFLPLFNNPAEITLPSDWHYISAHYYCFDTALPNKTCQPPVPPPNI